MGVQLNKGSHEFNVNLSNGYREIHYMSLSTVVFEMFSMKM